MTDLKFTYDQNPENYIADTSKLSIFNFQPNYEMRFHKNGKTIGMIDWNGPEMTFSGDLDESVKIFFEFLANSFKGRLEQERVAERERFADECIDLVASYGGPVDLEAAIRARGETK